MSRIRAPGLALGAAVLFGATTPFASILLRSLSPLRLSGALYLGVALLLIPVLLGKRAGLSRGDAPWMAASALVGGVIAPFFLVIGLRHTDAATASLLLAMEPVGTALIAWCIVGEHVSFRTAGGMAAIAVGALFLAWQGSLEASLGACAVLGAALCWAIDNNLSQRVASSDVVAFAAFKGIAAGSVSTILAFALHDPLPLPMEFVTTIALGFFGYGVSLVLFLRALRDLGTARTSAYFATAPFVGAAIGLALGMPTNIPRLFFAGGLMAFGVILHVTEHHSHEHAHGEEEHEHSHVHDEHHHHEHQNGEPLGEPHTHRHRHELLTHKHRHTPDLHHRHAHSDGAPREAEDIP